MGQDLLDPPNVKGWAEENTGSHQYFLARKSILIKFLKNAQRAKFISDRNSMKLTNAYAIQDSSQGTYKKICSSNETCVGTT